MGTDVTAQEESRTVAAQDVQVFSLGQRAEREGHSQRCLDWATSFLLS